MERMEPLGGGRYIWVTEDYGFGTDAVLLADFSRPPYWGTSRDREAVCELGTGCGILPLLWFRTARADGAPPVHCVELQPQAVGLARKSVEYNHLSPYIVIHEADWNHLSPLFSAGSFDRVVVNPPYFSPGAGKQSLTPAARLARHEQSGTLQGLADSAARLLRNGGVFCLCHRPERLADVVVALRSARLEPKRLRPVQQRASDAPWLMLWEARKNGRPGLSVLSPLVLKNPDGTPSQDYQSLFRVPDRQF